MQKAQLPHQQQEDERCHQLQEELCPGGETEILLFPDLLPVIQKSDRTEHQGKHQDENVLEMTVQHAGEAECQADQYRAEDKHHTAHGGSSALARVLLQFFLDLLSGLFFFQPWDIPFTEP